MLYLYHPVTLSLTDNLNELDLYISKVYLHTKNERSRSRHVCHTIRRLFSRFLNALKINALSLSFEILEHRMIILYAFMRSTFCLIQCSSLIYELYPLWAYPLKMYLQIKQVAQLSQRDCAAGWVGYGQKWKTVTGR